MVQNLISLAGVRRVECLLWAPLLAGAPPPAKVPRSTTQAMYRMCATLTQPERTLHVAAWPEHDMALVSGSGFL
jgi:hypothetical protein